MSERYMFAICSSSATIHFREAAILSACIYSIRYSDSPSRTSCVRAGCVRYIGKRSGRIAAQLSSRAAVAYELELCAFATVREAAVNLSAGFNGKIVISDVAGDARRAFDHEVARFD